MRKYIWLVGWSMLAPLAIPISLLWDLLDFMFKVKYPTRYAHEYVSAFKTWRDI